MNSLALANILPTDMCFEISTYICKYKSPLHAHVINDRLIKIKGLCEYDFNETMNGISNKDIFIMDWIEGNTKYRNHTERYLKNHIHEIYDTEDEKEDDDMEQQTLYDNLNIAWENFYNQNVLNA